MISSNIIDKINELARLSHQEAEVDLTEYSEEKCVAVLSNIISSLEASKSVQSVPESTSEGKYSKKNKKLKKSRPSDAATDKLRALEEELLSTYKTLDISNPAVLQHKFTQAIDSLRTERDLRIRYEEKLSSSAKECELLNDHVDKLLRMLKVEAAGRVRLSDNLSRELRTSLLLYEHNKKQAEVISSYNTYITSLKHGNEQITNQFALMTSKYNDLKAHIDSMRTYQVKIVEKSHEELFQLKHENAQLKLQRDSLRDQIQYIRSHRRRQRTNDTISTKFTTKIPDIVSNLFENDLNVESTTSEVIEEIKPSGNDLMIDIISASLKSKMHVSRRSNNSDPSRLFTKSKTPTTPNTGEWKEPTLNKTELLRQSYSGPQTNQIEDSLSKGLCTAPVERPKSAKSTLPPPKIDNILYKLYKKRESSSGLNIWTESKMKKLVGR